MFDICYFSLIYVIDIVFLQNNYVNLHPNEYPNHYYLCK